MELHTQSLFVLKTHHWHGQSESCLIVVLNATQVSPSLTYLWFQLLAVSGPFQSWSPVRQTVSQSFHRVDLLLGTSEHDGLIGRARRIKVRAQNCLFFLYSYLTYEIRDLFLFKNLLQTVLFLQLAASPYLVKNRSCAWLKVCVCLCSGLWGSAGSSWR